LDISISLDLSSGETRIAITPLSEARRTARFFILLMASRLRTPSNLLTRFFLEKPTKGRKKLSKQFCEREYNVQQFLGGALVITFADPYQPLAVLPSLG